MDQIKQDHKIEALQQALINSDVAQIDHIADTINPADLALFLQQLEIDQQIQLIHHLENAAYVFEFLPLNHQVQLVKKMDGKSTVQLIGSMHSDARTDLYKALPDQIKTFVFANLDRETKQQVQSLALYAEETAGAIMTSDYVTLPSDISMQQALEILRHSAKDTETLYLIYITNQFQKLEGVISLREIVQAPLDKTVQEVMTTEVIYGRVDEDQESVAKKLSHYDFIALPILDHDDHLLGIVTYDDAMDVFQEEFTEDFLKSGAVELKENISIRSAPILLLFRQRVFWLVFLVFGSLLSSIGIAHYEDIIAAHIVLVFFLPLLVGSGGNAGSQSATLMVRAIATGDVKTKDWLVLIGREAMVALCLGATMAAAVSILGYIRGDMMVALVLAISMMGIVMMGCLIGMSLPFVLNKLGLDPASASAPLVTSICDATGVLVYLFIASQLLF
nr:magnesium transporter [Acinetobacter sp. Ver3]